MCTARIFVLGAVAGGAAVWCLKDPVSGWIDARTRAMRERWAACLRAAADAIEGRTAGAAPPPARVAERVS